MTSQIVTTTCASRASFVTIELKFIDLRYPYCQRSCNLDVSLKVRVAQRAGDRVRYAWMICMPSECDGSLTRLCFGISIAELTKEMLLNREATR